MSRSGCRLLRCSTRCRVLAEESSDVVLAEGGNWVIRREDTDVLATPAPIDHVVDHVVEPVAVAQTAATEDATRPTSAARYPKTTPNHSTGAADDYQSAGVDQARGIGIADEHGFQDIGITEHESNRSTTESGVRLTLHTIVDYGSSAGLGLRAEPEEVIASSVQPADDLVDMDSDESESTDEETERFLDEIVLGVEDEGILLNMAMILSRYSMQRHIMRRFRKPEDVRWLVHPIAVVFGQICSLLDLDVDEEIDDLIEEEKEERDDIQEVEEMLPVEIN